MCASVWVWVPWPVCEPLSEYTGVSRVLPHQAEVKPASCVALCQSAVCVFLNMCLYVSFHTHICTDTTLLHLWRLPLFLFSNSLSFSPSVADMFSFRVVKRTHIFVITLGQKVICTHFHIHTRAGRHVLDLFCARIVLCPSHHCILLHMGRRRCPVLHSYGRIWLRKQVKFWSKIIIIIIIFRSVTWWMLWWRPAWSRISVDYQENHEMWMVAVEKHC